MRIGTRGSALALAQARLVAEQLDGAELVTIATAGDGNSATGDKSRWVFELERALTEGAIDLAVHSAKDVPAELEDGLSLIGAPERAAPEDVLCFSVPAASLPVEPATAEPGRLRPPRGGLEQLAPGARVGTSSLRRAAQLRAAREDLEVVSVRGNVDTRLRKLGAGDLDALVLARAGLQRLGREAEIGAVLDPARFVPSPGQGTLALEGRAGDEVTRAAVQAITDATAFACLRAERAVARTLGANCNTPLGAYAVDHGCGCLLLRAWVGLPDGSAWVGDELLGGFYDPDALGCRVAERLRGAGADELLTEAGRHALSTEAGGHSPSASIPRSASNPRFGQPGGAFR
jgi:hydroxymethylbilane synthase